MCKYKYIVYKDYVFMIPRNWFGC